MKKPKILIVTCNKKTGLFLAEELKSIFDGLLEIENKCMKIDKGNIFAGVNLVLFTSKNSTRNIVSRIPPGTDIMLVRRTLSVESYKKIQKLKPGTKAMLVNDNQVGAEETIALIHELGIKKIELVPVYPGLKKLPDLELAITPDETEYVPESIKKIINIGPRVIDISTITDIAIKFNLMDKVSSTILSSYIKKIIPDSIGLQDTLNSLIDVRNNLEAIINTINEGVITYDDQKKITQFNRVMEQLSGRPHWKVVGQSINRVFDELNFPPEIMDIERNFYDRIYTIYGKRYLVSKKQIKGKSKPNYLITFKETSQIEKEEFKVRQKLREKGLYAKYTFNDIIGKSELIQETISKARKMTRGDSEVLVSGESGVGKELFVQAIHNASRRKEKPFVAVNCSALPENLLESELFGYEEGAFTGARKGGKPGLFEQAHKGTIFLDEIGDLPLSLQSRLLRVLQEKEIMRIGGTGIIPVDVRVIAATNRSLSELIRQNLFRADLYYRLNVLPLQIPPLRERVEDIPLLADYFLSELGDRRRLNPEIIDILKNYNWPGNIRELRNCIKYMVNITEGDFTVNDIPEYIIRDKYKNSKSVIDIEELSIFILEKLKLNGRLGNSLGRYKLYSLAREEGFQVSESQIRTSLKKLKDEGLIKKVSRRSGHTISREGSKLLDKYKGNAR